MPDSVRIPKQSMGFPEMGLPGYLEGTMQMGLYRRLTKEEITQQYQDGKLKALLEKARQNQRGFYAYAGD